MSDYVVRATAADNTVRAFATVTTGLVQEAREIHGMSGVASAALGRTMTAAVMMAGMLKGDKDILTLQVKGNGPLGGIVVVTDSKANVRGYVQRPYVSLPLNEKGKFDVAGAIGTEGYLNIIKDLGMKEPYVGYVELVSGEIGEDIAYYFAYSEQTPSVVSLGTLVAPDESILHAGGFIIQLMPGAEDGIISYLEDKIANTPSVTSLLKEGKTPEEILGIFLGEKSLVITDRTICQYRCTCSRERMERGLISLGPKEIIDMAREQHGAELQCHFCNSKYPFTEEELMGLLDL